MPQVHSRTVMLEATRAVELRAGLILPPGFYIGTETYTRLEPVGTGLDRTPSRFEINLKANQLASIGAKVPPNLISEKIDVTKFVRSGQLIVV